MFYTYMHVKADTGQPFYIGKGKGNRAWCSKGRNRHWKFVVAKHGYTVQVLAHWDCETDALTHEVLLIESMREIGAQLANIAEGGLPGPVTKGMPKSAEHKAKISQAHLGKKKTPHRLECRQRRSEYMTGKKHSPETIEKIASYHRGKKRSEETRQRISDSKKVTSAETRARMSAAAKLRCRNKKLNQLIKE